MESRGADTDRQARRRARRRRQVRRRRLIALAAAAAVVALVGAFTLHGEAPGEAAARGAGEAHSPSVREGAPARSGTTSKTAARTRLGSGKQVTFAFAGDVHFESPIRERLASSPASVLAPVAPILRRADIAMVNLETAVTDRGTPASKAFTFRAPATAFAALRAGGVDVASVANNHGMDYGVAGLRDTLAAARRAGFRVVGGGADDDRAYAPYRRTVNGQRVAIIGATQVLDDHLVAAWSAGDSDPGLASAKRVSRLLTEVRDARQASDTVVVFLHWGLELASCPTASQRSLAKQLVAAGADVIVGSHAHVLLGAGRMQDALVAYGLGNFVFYAFREITSRTGVLEVTVTGRRVDGYRWRPARISGGIPSPLTGSAAAAARRDWRALRSCTGLAP